MEYERHDLVEVIEVHLHLLLKLQILMGSLVSVGIVIVGSAHLPNGTARDGHRWCSGVGAARLVRLAPRSL